MAQSEKIWVYESPTGIVKEGFDKEPPYMDYYKSKVPNPGGQAVLICPGGGYAFLALQHEGADLAAFFNQHGFDAFVLHYRINDSEQRGHRFPDQYNDVTTAMRVVKAGASALGLNPDKIGALGFSAGGHLASMLGTMHVQPLTSPKKPYEKFSSRPAFLVLGYPVISLNQFAHKGSAQMLLGRDAAIARLDSLSTHNRVTSATPPVFMFYSTDDDVVPVENGQMFYDACRKAGVPVAFHIYEHGGHGYGMAPKDPSLNSWTTLMLEWLRKQGYDVR